MNGLFYQQGIALGCALASLPALGASLQNRAGSYTDSEGSTRQRVEMGWQGNAQKRGDSSAVFALTMGRELSANDDAGQSSTTSDGLSLSAVTTSGKVNESRVLASSNVTGESKNSTGSLGFSRWIYHETFRVGFDLSRTLIERPESQILDVDSDVINLPGRLSSSGLSLAVRHLASPSTMIDYLATYVLMSNRPASWAVGLGIRQYVASTYGAVHFNLAYAENTGTIRKETEYGEVKAYQAEAAYLQTLWSKSRGKISYRYKREDETTRAYQDQLVYGADAAGLAFAHDVDRDGGPLTLEASWKRYWNNQEVAANTYEVGLSTSI